MIDIIESCPTRSCVSSVFISVIFGPQQGSLGGRGALCQRGLAGDCPRDVAFRAYRDDIGVKLFSWGLIPATFDILLRFASRSTLAAAFNLSWDHLSRRI